MPRKENNTKKSDGNDNKSKGKRFVSLHEKLENLEAREIDHLLQNLKRSFYIVSRNFAQVIEAFKFYQQKDDIWDLKNRPELDQFQKEFLRLIHNYTSSYYSLYEHTQRIKNHINKKEFTAQYKKKLKETGIEKISNFLMRFRGYTQHYQLPPLIAKLEYETIDEETGEGQEKRNLIFDRDELLDWDGWGKTRSFVEDFEENVDFLKVAKKYQQKIKDFTKWFDQAVREEFSDEFEEYESYLSELQEISRENLDDDILEAWGVDTEENS